MKKRIFILLPLVLAALILAYRLFEPAEESQMQSEPTGSTQTKQGEDSLQVENADVTDEELAQLSERFTPEEIENLKFSHQAAQVANQNVVFYGKCVDQDGNPIPDVRVSAKITKMRKSMISALINDSFKYHETVTTRSDTNGRFEFKDKGSLLVFEEVEREGYLHARGHRRGYSFGRILTGTAMAGIHQADPLKPVVFTLWKKGEGSDAVELKDRNGARADFAFSKSEMGNVLYYDLSQRLKVSNPTGDTMKVIAHNDGNRHVDPISKKFVGTFYPAWSFTLELPGGGFVPTDDLFLFRPPISGYQQKYIYKVPGGEKDHIMEVREQKFYFKTGDGNFGAFALNVIATTKGEMGFRFEELYFNPSGERSLEQF